MAAAGGACRRPLEIVDAGWLEGGIRWLLGRAEAGLEPPDFLLPAEDEEGQRYRHPGRHRQWLAGRAAAKWLLLEREGLVWSPENTRRCRLRRHPEGWPEVVRPDGTLLDLPLSISHTGDWVLCALGAAGGPPLGVDVETIEPRAPAFMEDFFSPHERSLLFRLSPTESVRAQNAIWCLKEALLKAVRSGLRRRATDVEVKSLGASAENGWHLADVRLSPEGAGPAWWRVSPDGRLVLAVGVLQGG